MKILGGISFWFSWISHMTPLSKRKSLKFIPLSESWQLTISSVIFLNTWSPKALIKRRYVATLSVPATPLRFAPVIVFCSSSPQLKLPWTHPILNRLLNHGHQTEANVWISHQHGENQQQIQKATAFFPYYRIDEKTFAEVEFVFGSRQIFVHLESCFKDFGGSVKLDEKDWKSLLSSDGCVMFLLEALEGTGSMNLSTLLRNFPEKILKDPAIPGKFTVNVNEKFFFSVWKPTKFRGAQINLCAVEKPSILQWGLTPSPGNMVCFSSGTFDYFSRFIIPRILRGVEIWDHVRETCSDHFIDCMKFHHILN